MGVIANGTAVKIEKNNHSLSASNGDNSLPKEFTIGRTNLMNPFKPVSIIMTDPFSVALDISMTDPGKVTGIMADICATSIFNDSYSYMDLPFYNFKHSALRHLVSNKIALNIPSNILPILKSWDLIVKKFIYNDDIIVLNDFTLNVQTTLPEIEESDITPISKEDLISVVENLGSAREILDYLTDYNETNGNILDPHLLSEIQDLRSMEGIYGNMKTSALKYIKNAFEPKEQ